MTAGRTRPLPTSLMTVSGYFSHFKLAFDACWNSQAVDGTRLIADSESSFSPSYYSHLVCASTYARFGLSFPAINTAPKPEVDWDEAFRLNYVHLRSLAIKIVGPNDAEDAVQTAFLNAVRTNNFAGRSSLRTWLYRLTINSCLMMLRKRNRKCEFVVCEVARPRFTGSLAA